MKMVMPIREGSSRDAERTRLDAATVDPMRGDRVKRIEETAARTDHATHDPAISAGTVGVNVLGGVCVRGGCGLSHSRLGTPPDRVATCCPQRPFAPLALLPA